MFQHLIQNLARLSLVRVLSPDQPGYGQVVSTGTGRRRARRNTQPVAPITSAATRERKTSWTVVTGTPGASSSAMPYAQSAGPLYPSPQMYHSSSPPLYSRAHPPTTWRHSPTNSSSIASLPQSTTVSNSPNYRERSHSRYSPYPGQSSTLHRKLSGSSGGSASLDIPTLSLHERRLGVEHRSQISEPITHASSYSTYISATESLHTATLYSAADIFTGELTRESLRQFCRGPAPSQNEPRVKFRGSTA